MKTLASAHCQSRSDATVASAQLFGVLPDCRAVARPGWRSWVQLTALAVAFCAELAKGLEFQILSGRTRIQWEPGRCLYDEALPALPGAFRNCRYGVKSRIDFTRHGPPARLGNANWQRWLS